jgi:CRISPR-associated protein Csc1
VKPDGWDVELGSASYLVNRTDRSQRRKVSTSNRPQVGKIKMLGIGNQARFYVLAQDALPQLPRYLRLGKWMSKARLETAVVGFQVVRGERRQVRALLNPIDLAVTSRIHTFDMLSIHPAPLIRNTVMDGEFLVLADKDHTLLPAYMRFGVEAMTNAR